MTIEGISIWLAIFGYSIAFIAFLYGLIFEKSKFNNYAYIMTASGLFFHTAAFILRWHLTGHFPVMFEYENSMTGTWFVTFVYVMMRFWFPQSKPFGIGILPIVVLVLGNSMQAITAHQPLEPPFRSNWLVVHVFFAWFAFAAFTIAFSTGILYLLKSSGKKGILERLPSLKLLDELSIRLILFGFFTEAVMIASGAIWAYGLWGRYWGWDPVETWSLISWLTYGVVLHLRIALGWKGKRAAWLSIVSLSTIMFLLLGIKYLSGIHTGVF